MLTITKIKVGIDTVYEKVYYDGTQQELEKQLNGISTIPFLQQKKLQNSYRTIYLHPRVITSVEVDDYIKRESTENNKVIDFESYKKQEKLNNPFEKLPKEELTFITKKCQEVMSSARNDFEEEKSIQISEMLLTFFLAHHSFTTEDKEEELKHIFEERFEAFKEGLLENKFLTEEQIKDLYINTVLSMPQFISLDELTKEEEMEIFVQIFFLSMHLVAWITTLTEEESLEAIKEENHLMNSINFIAFINGEVIKKKEANK